MMKIKLILVFVILGFQTKGQTISAQFAKWKNNAKAVYTLTHDDFASFAFDGIDHYADTIAYNRGVKFTFGVITGSCLSDDWDAAKRLIQHGHEVMNHTHTHTCSHASIECPNTVWSSYAYELDQSTDLIFSNTGSYPRYFIWPYDLYDQPSKDYLKNNLHYYGARGGINDEILDASQLNERDIPDFFNTNFSVYSPTTNASELNELIDLAITQGKWGMRELHGINDASWASLSIANYRNHCDYIKTKVDAGLLWNANASEVTTYLMQARAFIPTITNQPQYGRIKIAWNNPELDTSDLRSTVTLNIQLDGLTGYDFAYQNTESLPIVNHGDSISVNCFPHKGEIYLYNYDPATVDNSIFFDEYRTLVRQGDQGVQYSVSPQDADEYIWSYSGAGTTTILTNGNEATFDFSMEANNGQVSVCSVRNGKVSLPKTIDVTVLAVNDVMYGCPLPSTATFNITNQNDKKFLWLDAPIGGNELAFSSSLNCTIIEPDTFYIAQQNDSVLINVLLVPENRYMFELVDFMARKVTVQQELVFRNISFYSSKPGLQTVDIYEADGQTLVFSNSQNLVYTTSYYYQLVTLPLNLTLAPGDYYFKVSTSVVNYNPPLDPVHFNDLMTLYPEGYSVGDDGTLNLLDTKTPEKSSQIGLSVVKPAVLYPGERVKVYMKPAAMPSPSSCSGPQSVCANSTQLYSVPASTGLTPVYSYSDGLYDTTMTSAVGISIHFKDRAADGILSVQYKNNCSGEFSSAFVLPITVNKPFVTDLFGPSVINYPGAVDYTYSAVAGTTVSWNQPYAGVNTLNQTPNKSTLTFLSNLQFPTPSFLYYTVNQLECSATYALPVEFSKQSPTIQIISPAEGQQFLKGEDIPLVVSLSDVYEPVVYNFEIGCFDNDGKTYYYQFTSPHYEQIFQSDLVTVTGTCTINVSVSIADEFITKMKTFYISAVTNTSSRKEYTLSAYPNPTGGKISVASNWLSGEPVNCIAIDQIGKVYNIQFNNQGDELQFDFAPLPVGIYHLKISSGDKQYHVNVIRLNNQ